MELSEGELSHTSSSSSFVPVDQRQLQDAIQIIDENKHFNTGILDYINKTSPADVGNNYHIISVFGSQSTGKSTLLNRLFNTNFDVMDESNRQQTTKGIWLAYSPVVSTTLGHTTSKSNILVMDVEGTDGRERGEDQDFERKAALFALSTSEVLIINIWETQVGLYQGANMGLLKTVFEVNLSLFGKSKLETHNDHKVLLLIVIRDHVGVTPVESLAKTFTSDLQNMWSSLAKPAELEHLQFADFFDVTFHALNHKVLQPKEFGEGINRLDDRLVVSNELFKPEYHHDVPIDGWTMYAERCWEQIETNKDLDLPTQQILVAQFKCDEIVESVFQEFLAKYQHHFKEVDAAPDFEELGALFADLRQDAFEDYDASASRYNKAVYEQKRKKLRWLINDKLKEVFDVHAKNLCNTLLEKFEKDLVALKGKDFAVNVKTLSTKLVEDVNFQVSLMSLQGDLSLDEIILALTKDIDAIVAKQQVIELNSIVNKSVKKLSASLSKSIQFELGDPNEETWDNVLQQFKGVYEKFGGDFGLGTSSTQNQQAIEKFKFKSWCQFYDVTHKLISREKLLALLQDRFDDKFRYDENGLPKLYLNEQDLEKTFAVAKQHALQVLPILTFAKLADGSEIVPDYDIFDSKLREQFLGGYDDSDDEEDHCFAEIITEQEKSEVLAKFKKEVDAKYIETKRSIVQHITQIPYYIYLIILVLGWNEFMAIIRNPLFFSLSIVLGATVYVLYYLGLLRPALVVAQRTMDEVIVMAKTKLREVLIDDHEVTGRQLNKMAGSKENIELDDM
ncbi:dynamin-like GTPase [Candida albicans SC5314]|uniref:Protein SEY1 n=1 Tax=Candida albicans (strain SC5314 / ATCC MYA-2876) TaxID=237561 RepID=SEY1_CANAL|nr:dynamin-like GTPase [Candida albicans SC5314]Q9C0L9.2 RecName: Full=Protein SEY1 [Candida albicans SC5314]AOW30373.1 dynamin-like GTPase [Candida albicans SC5314]|eukprot:XP_712426.1 dynamin-like GTPase [Candida albicans SC5314]